MNTEVIVNDIVIPSREPILLTENPQLQHTAVKTLLSKGPTFIPTPMTADWNQLHLDLERFCNDIRKCIFFANSQPTPEIQIDDAPKKPSNWKAPKSNIPEAEIFLKQIERDLFSDVRPKKVNSNLTRDERNALKQCKDLLNNPDADSVIRMQDKGNKFVIVDKQTDLAKAAEQICKSSMEPLTENPTKKIVERVERWCERWKNNGTLSEKWT